MRKAEYEKEHERLLKKLLRARVRNIRARHCFDLGQLEAAQRNRSSAIAWFENAIQLGLSTEQKLRARLCMGSIMLKSGFKADAKQQLDMVTRQRPKRFPEVHRSMMRLHQRLEKAA
jgi:lipopolysaccharide biosynthesis regulator YciM